MLSSLTWKFWCLSFSFWREKSIILRHIICIFSKGRTPCFSMHISKSLLKCYPTYWDFTMRMSFCLQRYKHHCFYQTDPCVIDLQQANSWSEAVEDDATHWISMFCLFCSWVPLHLSRVPCFTYFTLPVCKMTTFGKGVPKLMHWYLQRPMLCHRFRLSSFLGVAPIPLQLA